MVGVGSIFESAARARVELVIFYFFGIGHAPYHSKKKKRRLGRIWLRARTPSPDSVFFLFLCHACCVPYVYCRSGTSLIGLSPSSYSPRPSALSPEISAFNHHACTLGSPPWGGRASKNRLRARGSIILLLFFCNGIPYHCQKNKKWPPANRLRALTPTHRSPASPLMTGAGGRVVTPGLMQGNAPKRNWWGLARADSRSKPQAETVKAQHPARPVPQMANYAWCYPGKNRG